MSAPDHWQSLTTEERMEMEKHARGLVRGSVIEDAASRFMAMCLAEAIGESKRRADICTTDEQVQALEAENARLREALEYIQKPQYGLQGIIEDGDRDEERANYFSAWCRRYQDRARAALRDIPPLDNPNK